MKTDTVGIPTIKKSKVTIEKKANVASSSCCTPKPEAAVCCTPSQSKEENSGACCTQPVDGSVCCDK